MKKLAVYTLVMTISMACFSQANTVLKIDTTQASVQYWSKWTNNLYDMGVETNKDSFFVKKEVLKLMTDSAYRKAVYPARYEWAGAVSLMKQLDLKAAFWHLINLYQDDKANRNLVMGTFALYDSLIDMDKVLLSTYYTYALPDPRVCRIVNGKPDIYRPDILEKELATTKEIAGYIWAYRKQKAAAKTENDPGR